MRAVALFFITISMTNAAEGRRRPSFGGHSSAGWFDLSLPVQEDLEKDLSKRRAEKVENVKHVKTGESFLFFEWDLSLICRGFNT